MTDVEILRDPASFCSANFDAKPWAGIVPLRIGRFGVGVRADTPGTEAALRAVLAAHVDDGLDAAPIYSVRAPEQQAVGRTFTTLYRGFLPIARSRGWDAVVDTLVGHLSDLARGPVDDRIGIDGVLCLSEAGAVIAPSSLTRFSRRFEHRLRRLGTTIVSRPWVALDVVTAEVVVEPADLPVDARAYAEVVGAPPPEPGRTVRAPVRRWVVDFTVPVGSRGAAVQHAAARVHAWPPGQAQQALEAVARTVTDVRWMAADRGLDRWVQALA